MGKKGGDQFSLHQNHQISGELFIICLVFFSKKLTDTEADVSECKVSSTKF